MQCLRDGLTVMQAGAAFRRCPPSQGVKSLVFSTILSTRAQYLSGHRVCDPNVMQQCRPVSSAMCRVLCVQMGTGQSIFHWLMTCLRSLSLARSTAKSDALSSTAPFQPSAAFNLRFPILLSCAMHDVHDSGGCRGHERHEFLRSGRKTSTLDTYGIHAMIRGTVAQSTAHGYVATAVVAYLLQYVAIDFSAHLVCLCLRSSRAFLLPASALCRAPGAPLHLCLCRVWLPSRLVYLGRRTVVVCRALSRSASKGEMT